MSAIARVALLAIGNELLNGEVQDCNLHTLARRLTQQGFRVEQAAMVRDDPPAIAASLRALLAPRPDVLLVSGGLGPTADDCTLSAVAAALGRPLLETPAARQAVESAYDRLLAAGYVPQRGPEEARRKMSRLPEGALPLFNPVGVAPGVWLEPGETILICLPGVPAELAALLEGTVIPRLSARFGRQAWAEGALVVQCEDEADLAGILREVAARYPEVYVKSLAQPFPVTGVSSAENAALRILAAAHALDVTAAQAQVEETLRTLESACADAGVPVLRREIQTSFPDGYSV